MHRWPDAAGVVAAAREWAERLAKRVPAVLAVGYFGSYARGDAGVGSDLDLVVIVRDRPREQDLAGDAWAADRLGVPAERLVYTPREWKQLRDGNARFWRTLRREARWLVGAPPE